VPLFRSLCNHVSSGDSRTALIGMIHKHFHNYTRELMQVCVHVVYALTVGCWLLLLLFVAGATVSVFLLMMTSPCFSLFLSLCLSLLLSAGGAEGCASQDFHGV
jgi:hypothetical protein